MASLLTGYYHDVLASFENRKDQIEIQELLDKEGILQVISTPQQREHNLIELFIITQYASILHVRFDLEKQAILDPIRVNLKVRELMNLKVHSICCADNLSSQSNTSGLTMLVSGDNVILCQIRVEDEGIINPQLGVPQPQVIDPINEQGRSLLIGLEETSIENPTELSVNHTGSYILVGNDSMIQIFGSAVNPNQGSQKQNDIQLHSLCILQKDQLPVHIGSLSSVVFNFHEVNTFALIGQRNLAFEDGENPHGARSHIVLEKFFINAGDEADQEDLTTESICYLQLGRSRVQKANGPAEVVKYCFSATQEFLAVYTSDNSLYTYKVGYLISRPADDLQQQEEEEHFHGPVGKDFQTEIVDVLNSDDIDESMSTGRQNKGLDDFKVDLDHDQADGDGHDDQYNILEDNHTEEHSVEEDVKPIRPLAKIEGFLRRPQGKAKDPFVADMRWVLNDTFLVVATEDKVLIFDALLKPFTIQSKFEEAEGSSSVLKLRGSGLATTFDPSFKIFADQQALTFQNELVQSNLQYIGLFDCKDPKVNLVEGCSAKVQIIQLCNQVRVGYDWQTNLNPYSQKFVVEQCLSQGRSPKINHAFKLIYNCLGHEQPVAWLSSTLQLINLCLTQPRLLAKQKISKQKLLALFTMARTKQDFQYFFHTIKFLFVKLAIKYLSLNMLDEALFLAIKTSDPDIMAHVESVAYSKKDVVALNLLNIHQQKLDKLAKKTGDGAQQTSMVKAMTQMANFTKKVLKKEDYLNLYKDFYTLLKIDDISDLELKDFNGWEFDLEAYQKALEHELAGEFDKALEVYKKNKIQSDIERVKALKEALNKEISPGERHLSFQNVNDAFQL